MTREGAAKKGPSREDRVRVLLALAPAFAWSAAFALCGVLSAWVCATGRRWSLPLVTGLAFAAAGAAGLASFRRWRASRAGRGEEDGVGERRRFLELGGVLLALISLLAIVALTIPALLHRPCD